MSGLTWSEAVRSTHPRQPKTPPPGSGFEERLLKREAWTDRSGCVHRLTEMSDEYLWAVLGYLRWYAPEVRALVPDEDRADVLPLRAWIEAQPIWGAIACEMVRRAILAHPSEAMERLMAAGPVPWEMTDAAG